MKIASATRANNIRTRSLHALRILEPYGIFLPQVCHVKKNGHWTSGRKFLMLLRVMVGTPRFELGTSRTPSVRATRLRHVPSACLSISAKDQLSNQAADELHPFGIQNLSASISK